MFFCRAIYYRNRSRILPQVAAQGLFIRMRGEGLSKIRKMSKIGGYAANFAHFPYF
jgi:hypothetical protein